MKLTPRLQTAINLAARQHDGQKRKGFALPYIVHPFSVALIVAEYLSEEDAVIAALLHDVLEDTVGYTAADLSRDYGPHVRRLVEELSEDKTLPWRERKEKHLLHLQTASETSLIITAADKIHNLSSLTFAMTEGQPADRQGIESILKNSLWYFEGMNALIDRRLPAHPIRERLAAAFDHARPYFS